MQDSKSLTQEKESEPLLPEATEKLFRIIGNDQSYRSCLICKQDLLLQTINGKLLQSYVASVQLAIVLRAESFLSKQLVTLEKHPLFDPELQAAREVTLSRKFSCLCTSKTKDQINNNEQPDTESL